MDENDKANWGFIVAKIMNWCYDDEGYISLNDLMTQFLSDYVLIKKDNINKDIFDKSKFIYAIIEQKITELSKENYKSLDDFKKVMKSNIDSLIEDCKHKYNVEINSSIVYSITENKNYAIYTNFKINDKTEFVNIFMTD